MQNLSDITIELEEIKSNLYKAEITNIEFLVRKIKNIINSSSELKTFYNKKIDSYTKILKDENILNTIQKLYDNIKDGFGEIYIPNIEGESAEQFYYYSFSYNLYKNPMIDGRGIYEYKSLLGFYQALIATNIHYLKENVAKEEQNAIIDNIFESFEFLKNEINTVPDFYVFNKLLEKKNQISLLKFEFVFKIFLICALSVINELLTYADTIEKTPLSLDIAESATVTLFYNDKNKKIKIEDEEYSFIDDERNYKIIQLFIKKLPEKLTSQEIAGEFNLERNTATKIVNTLKEKYPTLGKYITNSKRHSKGYTFTIPEYKIKKY